MYVYDGDKNDMFNFTTDKFLRINSCGFQNVQSDFDVVRNKGRVDYHILLINSGYCIAYRNDTEYRLEAGNLILYYPGEKQRYIYKAESTGLWCHFCGTAVKEILTDAQLPGGIYKLSPSPAVQTRFTDMINKFHTPGGQAHATALLPELIYLISSANTGGSSDKTSAVITPVMTYIQANFNKEISLDELALKSGYSKSRFSRIFAEFTGVSPIKYLNNTRLNASCEMLEATDIPIGEIANHCGFNDPLYFSRSFARKYGKSPDQYRKQYRNY